MDLRSGNTSRGGNGGRQQNREKKKKGWTGTRTKIKKSGTNRGRGKGRPVAGEQQGQDGLRATSGHDEDGVGGRRKGSRKRLGSKEEEESNSSQERKKRKRRELKEKVAEYEDSSESTSSRDLRKRQLQEDGSPGYSEGDEDDGRANITKGGRGGKQVTANRQTGGHLLGGGGRSSGAAGGGRGGRQGHDSYRQGDEDDDRAKITKNGRGGKHGNTGQTGGHLLGGGGRSSGAAGGGRGGRQGHDSEGDEDDGRADGGDGDADSGSSGYMEDDAMRSVDNDSEGDDYNQAKFLEQCVRGRYAPSSRTGFRQRFRQMQKWLHRNAPHYLPLRRPFKKSLCIRWCHHQMKRRNAKGYLYGAGNLLSHIQMLKYKGFTKWHKPVPTKLDLFFRNAHEAHRRRVMKLVDECKQALPDSHAQNAGWPAMQYACEKTHDWQPGRGHDLRTNLFLTGCIQTISRGERVGKVPTMAFRMGDTGDHICAGKGLSSKTNQKGNLSYDKRFWANYKNCKMCFVTALGRHLVCQRKNQLSEFLFMSKTEAKEYSRKLKASRKKKNHKESNVGPHLKFDRLIAKVFDKLPPQRRVAMGISQKKRFVGHCKRKGGYARVVNTDGPTTNMISNRADHRATNHHTYSARPIFDVEGSGGPPPRHDITMSKSLSGLTQYTPEFNDPPPHWDPFVSDQIKWENIVPCYEELPRGMKSVVPFVMAQVVYHYHRSNNGLSSSHDLFKTPLWTTHQELRCNLHGALRGADTGQESVLSKIFRDKKTDKYLWTKESHETINDMKKDIKELKAAQTEQTKLLRVLVRRSDGGEQRYNPVDASASVHDDADEAYEHPEGFGEPNQLETSSDPAGPALPAPPAVFEIEDGISVETAWHGWHGTYHNKEPGTGTSFPWKKINKDSLCISTATDKRRDTLSKLSKIGKLVKFLQGDTDDAEVEKDVSHAWDVCTDSARETLKAQGLTEWPLSGSYRTAYMELLKLRKNQKPTFDTLAKRTVDTTSLKTVQTHITTFFNKKGQLEDMKDAVDVEDNPDSIGGHASANSSEEGAVDIFDTSSLPPQECFICPLCPESGGQNGRDLVVYRDSNALWQHWDAHHGTDQKPSLWEIHRVQGAKLMPSRSAPWTRVANALSVRAPDYEMKKMRQDIKSGKRQLAKGTHVELQPDQTARDKGTRWFAVVRDSRVIDGKIYIQYCEDNCQAIHQGQIGKVWVESIIRVAGGKNLQFDDVPLEPPSSASKSSTGGKRSNQKDLASPSCKKPRFDDIPVSPPSARASKAAAASASCTPRSQAGLTTTSPAKSAQFSPSKSPKHNAKGACASSIVDKTIQKVAPASSAKTSPYDDTGIQNDVAARIRRATRSDANALKQFDDANKLLEKAGWSRCLNMEQDFPYYNLMHPNYSVKPIPRDGKCMFHCMLAILEAEHETSAPTRATDLQEQLAQYAEDQEPPEGQQKGKYGGIFADEKTYLPLEESIRGKNYGGEAALAIFVQMYGITVHCIAPESNASEVVHKGDGKSTNQYYMLQTLSWNTWNKQTTYDPVKEQTITSYERNYVGDHWQLLEAASKELPCGEVSQTKGIPASASSAAATAPKKPPTRAATIAPQNLTFDESEQSAAPERHTASPSFTLGVSATEENYPASVHFMLREVSGTKKFVRNPIPDFASKMHNRLRVVTVQAMHFLEDDFGETYRMVYPSSVQQLLNAFPDLDESHRSFFISLGIGANLDPYTLQHTFRSNALRIPKHSRDVDQKIIQTLQPGCVVNWRVLQWCWPAALDAFRIHVLDSNQVFVLESPGTHKKSDMILRFHKHRYTLLHAIEGATAEGLRQKVPTTDLRLSPETNRKDISTFDEFFDSNCFVSAAFNGTEPSNQAWDTMWKEATDAAGLDYDEKSQKWTTMPPGLGTSKSKTKAFTDGSLHTTSWKELQEILLSAASPAKDVTFMDAGSESGKGMFRMMSDKRITHVAGVELQQAWYDASCTIMSHIRAACKEKNYRMPAVTIVRSCMVDPSKQELDYLYSIATIMWMNNFVFGQVEFFAAKSSNKNAPMPILPGIRDLTTNAAFRFSQAYSGVTYIAVHITDGFLEKWNYKIFKQPFKMRVTWGETKWDVTILQHNQPNIQRLEMTEGMGRTQKSRYGLPIPNLEEIQLWDEYMHQWNDLIPSLYNAISKERFYTDALRGTQINASNRASRLEQEKKKKPKVIELDSDQEPDQSQSYCVEDAIAKSAAAKMTQALPSDTNSADPYDWTHLVTLTDSNWLVTEIMDAYRKLLKKEFQSIIFMRLDANTTGKALKQIKVLVSSMNLNTNHWIATKLDLNKNIAAIADSLHDSYKSMHEAVFDMLQTKAEQAGHTKRLQRCTVTVPNQCNTNDCGVLACLFQLIMAQTVSA